MDPAVIEPVDPGQGRLLFLDARQVFRQVDRAHRDFTAEQTEFLANIVRLYRDEKPELVSGGNALVEERFPNGEYADVKGLCKVTTIEEIEAQGWSLNPGRYVGTEVGEIDDEVFEEQLAESHAELRALGAGPRARRHGGQRPRAVVIGIDLNAPVRAGEQP